MRRLWRLIRRCLLAFALVASPLRAQSPSSRAPAPEVLALLRLLIADSLVAGGTRKGQLLLAADSRSKVLLTNAGLVVDTAPSMRAITCPGSTTSAGPSAPLPVGYFVHVSLRTTSDSAGWLLGVEKSCAWANQGSGHSGFAQGCEWEIRKVAGHWRIMHWVACRIT